MTCTLVRKCVSKTGAFRECSVSCDYRRARPWGRQGWGPLGGPAIWRGVEVAGGERSPGIGSSYTGLTVSVGPRGSFDNCDLFLRNVGRGVVLGTPAFRETEM